MKVKVSMVAKAIIHVLLVLFVCMTVSDSTNMNMAFAKATDLDKYHYSEKFDMVEEIGNLFRDYDDMVWDNGVMITPSERTQIKELFDDRFENESAVTTEDKINVIYKAMTELFDYDADYQSKLPLYKRTYASPALILKHEGKLSIDSEFICSIMQCYMVTVGIDTLQVGDKREDNEYNIIAFYDEDDSKWKYCDPSKAINDGLSKLPIVESNFETLYEAFSGYYQPGCINFGNTYWSGNVRSIYVDKASFLESNLQYIQYILIYNEESKKVIMTDMRGNPLAGHSYFNSNEKTGENGEVTTGWLTCTSYYSESQDLFHKAYCQFGILLQGYVTLDGKEYNFKYGGDVKYHRVCYMPNDFLAWEILELVDKPKEETDAIVKWRNDKLTNLERVAEKIRQSGYRYPLDYTDEELEYLQNAANEATEFSYVKKKAEIYQPLISINGIDIGIPETEAEVTEVQKAIAIIVYIREHLKYEGGYIYFDGYTALTKGYGTCAQYAELFCDLCELSGITSLKVIGALSNRHALYGDNFSDHAFNAAYLDGTWYYTDPTNIINLFTMDTFRGLIPLGLVNESHNSSYHMVYLSKDDMMREEAQYRTGLNWVYDFDDEGELGVYLYNYEGELVVNRTDGYFATDAKGKRETLTGFIHHEETVFNDDGELEKWDVKTYLQCGLPVYGNRTIDGIPYEFGRERDIGNGIPYIRDHRISVSPKWNLNLKNGIGPYEYTGEEICPKPNITYTVDGVEKGLVEGVDYELSYVNNINVNVNSNIKAAIIITGLGEYNYGAVINFTIKPYEIKEEDVVWPEERDFIWSIDYEKDGGIPSVEPSFSNPLLNGNAYIEYGPVTFMDDMEHIYSINGTVTVKGNGNCTGEVSRDFSTTKLPITDENAFRVSLAEEEFVYNNTNKEPEVIIEWLDAEGNVYRRLDGGNETEVAFNKDKEFVVTYADNKNAGEATLTVKGLKNFEGSLDKTFVINRADIAANENTVDIFINAKPNISTYTGLPLEPIFDGIQQSDQMTQRQIYLSENEDYIIEYSNNVHAGEAKAVMKGIGNYTGEIERTFTISPKLINKDSISLSKGSVAYNGEEQMPSVTVEGLTEGEDYTVICKQYNSETDSYVETRPIEAGIYKIDVVIINTDYQLAGSGSIVYEITSTGDSGGQPAIICDKHELSYVEGTLPDCFKEGTKEHYVCNVCGKKFYDSEAALEVISDFYLRIPADTENGHNWSDWEVIRLADTYNDGLKRRVCKNYESHVQYEVIPKTVNGASSSQGLVNGGSNIANGEESTLDENEESKESDETSSNDESSTFASNDKVKLSSVKNNKKKSFTAKWKKLNGASGYEVQYALNKKFTNSRKTKRVNKTSVTVKKLAKGKKYYIRVRAYAVDNSGTKKYGKWSSVKKVKIRK